MGEGDLGGGNVACPMSETDMSGLSVSCREPRSDTSSDMSEVMSEAMYEFMSELMSEIMSEVMSAFMSEVTSEFMSELMVEVIAMRTEARLRGARVVCVCGKGGEGGRRVSWGPGFLGDLGSEISDPGSRRSHIARIRDLKAREASDPQESESRIRSRIRVTVPRGPVLNCAIERRSKSPAAGRRLPGTRPVKRTTAAAAAAAAAAAEAAPLARASFKASRGPFGQRAVGQRDP